MDSETTARPNVDLLERMLIDETAEPTSLPLSLLENITNCFSDEQKIGSGGFAVVYKGIVGKRMIAVKKLTKYDLPEKKFLREVECLRKTKHKNVVRFLGYCYETKGEIADFKGKTVISDIRNWLLCFEYVPKGSLDNHITDASCGLEWRKRYEIIKGICEGLLHLHEKRILHLDLKPGNILIDEHMVPKIADFGLSVCLREDQNWASTLILHGSLGYLPPEFFRGQHGFASDIYSLGVIIVEIVTGKKGYPEDENVVENWMNRLERSDQRDVQLEQVRVCTRIAMECMDSDPKKRPNASYIVGRLEKTSSTVETTARPNVDLLERMLIDETAEPTSLPLSLLENITNCFSDEQKIGSGGFAVVYKGIVGKRMIAVKKLTKYDLPEKKFLREVECLMKAKHKNVVRFLGYCYETKGEIADFKGKTVISDIRNWLLCFEYVPKGSLDNHITDASHGLEWRKRYEIIKGICEGLLHLHDKRILHLDLKPGNILVDEHMVPKIADFGLSVCLREDQNWASTLILHGSLGYLPPEFFRGKHGFASDIYSLGVIIVEIVTGKKWYPEDENVVENWMNRLEGSDQRDVQLEQVKVCTKIGMECMESDPKKRPDASHIIDRLEKMSSTETGISSSSVEKEVSFQKDHYCQGKIANLSPDYLGKDIKEHAETEELGEYGGTLREDCWQQGLEEDLCDQWSLQGVEDTKQTVSSQGASISGSNSGVLYKLKNLNFFNRKKIRREYAKNGGPTVASAKTIKLFKNKELKPFFKSSDLIFKDDFGEVYEGFVDNVPVTLRKLIDVENDSFANEVIIQARVIHKNIVRLIGCCLESDNPILVYELFSEKNLQDLLHSNNKVPLNFGARLSIAATSAGALAYMHSVANRGILHGDFKPANILFDDNFVLKISYFGMLRMTSIDIIGDTTYMDPVYLQTGLLTEKSDVYSFGVVMLELLTRKKATLADNNSLVKNFLDNHTEGRKLTELYDKEIAVTGDLDLIDNMAEIATECLSLDMSRRPRMIDVAKRLSILNRSHKLAHQQAS